MTLSYDEMARCGVRFVLDMLELRSPYGRRRLKELRPYECGEQAEWQRELNNLERTLAVWHAFEREFARLGHLFSQMKDIRRSLVSCGEGDVLDEVELFEIKLFLLQLSQTAPLLLQIDAAARYEGIVSVTPPDALAILDIDKSGVASFAISGRYSAALTEARRQKRNLEEAMRRATGEAKEELAQRRTKAVAAEQAEEERVRAMLSEKLRPYAGAMLADTETVGMFDLLMAKAVLALRYTTAKPVYSETLLAFEAMTNPMVAARLKEENETFTPVSLRLEPGATVITGANMGGKSVALKTLAMNVWLAQCGFYAFAASARCPLFDSLWLVNDDLEDTNRGLSSFGGEIARLREILEKPANSFSLILLDEFARGTNPAEGAAIAKAVAEYLNTGGDIAVMTTHFDGVAPLARAHYQVAGLKREELAPLAAQLKTALPAERAAAIAKLMDYRLLRAAPGEEMPHDALAICRLLGIAENIIKSVEKNIDNQPNRL